MQETGLEGPATVTEEDSGETGDDEKRCCTRKVEDEKLPPESTAVHTRRPELFQELGSDVETGQLQQSGDTNYG